MIASPAAPNAPNDARESGATLYGLYMLAVAAVVFWRMVRRHLDEMFQRIVFEGMALALSIFLLLMPALLVALGVEVSRRRYQ